MLETALIAAQGRADRGDMEGAALLLDDVEAALDAQGEPTRPSLQAGRAILDLLATQDRALLRADRSAYQATLDRGSAPALQARIEETIGLPLTDYWQELVRLDVADDGQSAAGVVLVHGRVAGGDFAGDGRLLAVRFVRDSTTTPAPGTGGRWLLAECEPAEPEIIMPPNPGPS